MGLAPMPEEAVPVEAREQIIPEGQPFNAETAKPWVTMIDATHANAGNIPTDVVKVAGYDTGTTDIDWTDGDWKRFPNAGKVVIDQSYKESPGFGNYAKGKANIADVEAGTGSVADAVKATRERISNGEEGWVYGSRKTIEEIAGELTGKEQAKTGAWLADWNLSEAEAIAMLGSSIGGVRVVAVQWASPSSNPGMVVPGGSQTLKDANVDVSVTEAAWFGARAGKSGDVSVRDAEAALETLRKFVSQS